MPRIARIATIAMANKYGPTITANRQRMAGLVEQALAEKPDIIAIPESFTLAGLTDPKIEEMAEEVPGPTLEMFSGVARANSVYILCPILARRPDGLHIEAFLLDRAGQMAGSYQKHHPVVEGSNYQKVEFGSRPGSEFPVFSTDFGRIGVQICFDIEYRDGWDTLDHAGAEIFFWLSAAEGGRGLNCIAWNYHRYVASAVIPTFARIINIMGETLAITGEQNPVVASSVDLDIALFHMDFNKSQIPAIREEYGPDVNLQTYQEEGLFTIQSNRADLPVSEIIRTFQLDPLKDYLQRCQLLQDALRSGAPLPEIHPPYWERIQWC